MPKSDSTITTLETDHKRGCQGREYICSCGYDDAKDQELTCARISLEKIAGGHSTDPQYDALKGLGRL
jgi:hypothetical protein